MKTILLACLVAMATAAPVHHQQQGSPFQVHQGSQFQTNQGSNFQSLPQKTPVLHFPQVAQPFQPAPVFQQPQVAQTLPQQALGFQNSQVVQPHHQQHQEARPLQQPAPAFQQPQLVRPLQPTPVFQQSQVANELPRAPVPQLSSLPKPQPATQTQPARQPLRQPAPLSQSPKEVRSAPTFSSSPLVESRPHVAIVAEERKEFDGQNFQSYYQSEDGTVVETVGSVDVNGGVRMQGNVEYRTVDGQPITFSFEADENGYRPQGAHIPQMPSHAQALIRMAEEARARGINFEERK